MDVKPTIKKRSSPSKPVSTPRKRSKVIKASPSTPTDGTPPTSSSAGDAGSVDLWADVEGSTPEKRAAIVMLLFDEGAKSLGLAVLAKKVSILGIFPCMQSGIIADMCSSIYPTRAW